MYSVFIARNDVENNKNIGTKFSEIDKLYLWWDLFAFSLRWFYRYIVGPNQMSLNTCATIFAMQVLIYHYFEMVESQFTKGTLFF